MFLKVGHNLITSMSEFFHQIVLKTSAGIEDPSSGFLSLWTRLLKALARPFRRSTTMLARYLHVVRHWILILLRGLGITIGVVLATGVAYKVVKFTYEWSLQRKRERQEQVWRQQEREKWRRRDLERQLERNSRLEIERQASIRRRAQEQPPRPAPDGVTTTLASIRRPPPPSPLELYIEHSRDAQAKQMHEGNLKLSKCWGVILEGLCNVRVSPASVPGLSPILDLTTLRAIWDYGDQDKDLLDLLINLARQAGLEKVAEVYMEPLL